MKINYLLGLLLLVGLSDFNQGLYAQRDNDTISFETPTSKIIIDSASSKVWQIGRPGKKIFMEAHTGEKAILTDTVNSYPPNDTASFIYVIQNPYTQTCATSMEFWHKYDMDTLTDKGIIEASYDGGKSWLMVSDTNGQYGEYFFEWEGDYHEISNQLSGHPLTTTGRSDGWIKSTFWWQWWVPVKADTIILNPDSLMVKFTFISDSIETSREGWMIDDIVTSPMPSYLCTGIGEKLATAQISISPNPFSFEATLESEFPLKNTRLTIFNANGQKMRTLDHLSGSSVVLSRDNLSQGLYFLVIEVENKVVSKKFVIR